MYIKIITPPPLTKFISGHTTTESERNICLESGNTVWVFATFLHKLQQTIINNEDMSTIDVLYYIILNIFAHYTPEFSFTNFDKKATETWIPLNWLDFFVFLEG